MAVLELLLRAMCSDGDEVVYAWRSFEAYPILVQTTGAGAVQVPLRADGAHRRGAQDVLHVQRQEEEHPEQRGHAHHRQAHGDRFLRTESQNVHEDGNGQDTAASPQQSQRDSDHDGEQQRQSVHRRGLSGRLGVGRRCASSPRRYWWRAGLKSRNHGSDVTGGASVVG